MAVTSATENDYLLPCGRGLEQVWQRLDAVEAGRADDHEASCPHCAAARESLFTLRTATRELIEEPDPPPPDLFGRIMSAVRAEVRRGRTLALSTPHPGTLEVSEQAVAVVLRYAADTVDGVRARSCHVHGRGPGADGEQTIAVEMTIAVRMGGRGVEELIPRVRERVRAALSARIGLALERLDITVVDIYEEER
ncbi:Asp23/Gls24 family envelope stress response protein [Nocardia transvalensis]|uniref:Asp23/Gls24 family envelope stress response protein n=1 Tax=Nocardia transvalensis TaxID=37333 RepID=UPI0018935B6A|nr:Asp23/Gls24 family envelope stress response protein [Nocardia transvalensis]MBF6326917.1 Asp23/Gls24 family envelope stress response protein [Nocardia transvalensis]